VKRVRGSFNESKRSDSINVSDSKRCDSVKVSEMSNLVTMSKKVAQ
jgi:hypothetical protein